MATTDERRSKTPVATRSVARPARDGAFRFSIEQFYQLDELGFFEGRHVELIEGIICEMTIRPAHALASELIHPVLFGVFGAGWRIRMGLPLDTGRRSLLEPDVAVFAGGTRDLGLIHPASAILIIEISNTTLRKDRTVKAHLYAQAGISDYWILNLVDRQLEVHRNPGPDSARKGRFGYAEVTIVPESGNMAPLAAPETPIAVADLLP